MMKHLTVAACRKRDRMNIDSMLKIFSVSDSQIIQANVDTITVSFDLREILALRGKQERCFD